MKLSESRATSVAHYLEGLLGLEIASRVYPVGLGEPEEGEEKTFDQDHRRVDLRVDLRGTSGAEREPLDALRLELHQRSLK